MVASKTALLLFSSNVKIKYVFKETEPELSLKLTKETEKEGALALH